MNHPSKVGRVGCGTIDDDIVADQHLIHWSVDQFDASQLSMSGCESAQSCSGAKQASKTKDVHVGYKGLTMGHIGRDRTGSVTVFNTLVCMCRLNSSRCEGEW